MEKSADQVLESQSASRTLHIHPSSANRVSGYRISNFTRSCRQMQSQDATSTPRADSTCTFGYVSSLGHRSNDDAWRNPSAMSASSLLDSYCADDGQQHAADAHPWADCSGELHLESWVRGRTTCSSVWTGSRGRLHANLRYCFRALEEST
ncbi:uncharacterized protein EI97DRAFT_256045 [Westerdykella ornata]|uniref:Uncharacterized protein n=1 Tax=Westerdykella ornata TaxID=318751 RepID=A0A6A6JRX8_WESOR|nr:uncharacterized protein EI97DRAFT_256045 [Westerdykella ornata]KAF2278486.1 hypothetical protein EI97DRAFT_256045 [Westerdykella ornata]